MKLIPLNKYLVISPIIEKPKEKQKNISQGGEFEFKFEIPENTKNVQEEPLMLAEVKNSGFNTIGVSDGDYIVIDCRMIENVLIDDDNCFLIHENFIKGKLEK